MKPWQQMTLLAIACVAGAVMMLADDQTVQLGALAIYLTAGLSVLWSIRT